MRSANAPSAWHWLLRRCAAVRATSRRPGRTSPVPRFPVLRICVGIPSQEFPPFSARRDARFDTPRHRCGTALVVGLQMSKPSEPGRAPCVQGARRFVGRYFVAAAVFSHTCGAAANSRIISRLNAGMSSGFRLVTRFLSTTTS